MSLKSIKTALISVYDKSGLAEIVHELEKHGVKIISTGGTKSFIESRGVRVSSVEEITGYPSILGGRVKTLHPKIFGGILYRRDEVGDADEVLNYNLPVIDLVIVDLYPFEETLKVAKAESDIIEKIDIGGVSLIRAAAKNYKDVVVIPGREYYPYLLEILMRDESKTSLEQRYYLAKSSFELSSRYDSAIFDYFSDSSIDTLKINYRDGKKLRYGENPHQSGRFFGQFDEIFTQLHGKQISYNNLLDISSAVDIISEFQGLTVAILKHTNACGLASRGTILRAWRDALAGDPLSAFGGIIISNSAIDKDTAVEINKIFYEVLIAPSYTSEALLVLRSKKNRIILVQKRGVESKIQVRTVLNGFLVQDKDIKIVCNSDLQCVTERQPTDLELEDLIFANKIVKNSKSNAIVLVKDKQLLGSGVGQTSRVDALKGAISKAKAFNFDLSGAVMASDAFFPFSDSVEIAYNAGISAVIQPGGSIKDKDSIDFCNKNAMTMVFSGFRHFKH